MKKKTVSLKSFPDFKMNQSEFAKLIGCDRSRVSRLIASGIISSRDGWLTSLHKYIDHLRERAAGRRGDGDLDLVQERAALAKSQRGKIDLESRKMRSEFAPRGLVTEYMYRSFSVIRARLLSFPTRVKSLHPNLSTQEFQTTRELVHECLTELARTNPFELPESREIFSQLAAWQDGITPDEKTDDAQRAGTPQSGKAHPPGKKNSRHTS